MQCRLLHSSAQPHLSPHIWRGLIHVVDTVICNYWKWALCGWRVSCDLMPSKVQLQLHRQPDWRKSRINYKRNTESRMSPAENMAPGRLLSAVCAFIIRYWRFFGCGHSLRSADCICSSAVSLSVTLYRHVMGLSDFYEIHYRGMWK